MLSEIATYEYFRNGNNFSGNVDKHFGKEIDYAGKRFKVLVEKGESLLVASVWRKTFYWETKVITEKFPLSECGLQQAVKWIHDTAIDTPENIEGNLL